MNRKAKFTLAAAVMTLFTLQLSAQGPGGGRGFQMTEEDIKERTKMTAETLGLNEDQHKKIEAVDLDFYNKMQIERQKMRNADGPPPDREEMRARMMKMRDERNAEYEKVLSADQYKQFIELQEQRRNEMRQQRQQNNPDGQSEERPARGRGRG